MGSANKKRGRKMHQMNVLDVARYILNRLGAMSAVKLQKLVYYAQAWSLVWDEEPLFNQKIEAWAHGPVAPALYKKHKGQFTLYPSSFGHGDARHLSKTQRETVDAVIKFYGSKSAHWLSELTHREAPWRDARLGLLPGERGSQEIDHAAMAEYYAGL